MGGFIFKCSLGFLVFLVVYFSVLVFVMSNGSGTDQQSSHTPDVIGKWAFIHALFYSTATVSLLGVSLLLKKLPGRSSYIYIPFLLAVLSFVFVWIRNLSQPILGVANLQVAGVLFAVFLFILLIIWIIDK